MCMPVRGAWSPSSAPAGASPRPTGGADSECAVCRHNRQDRSAAWHRRRPGGPSRYSAADVRACRVIPMRAARGAASSAQATDRSLPGRPESSFPPLGLLSPPNPLRWASAGAPITASANGAGGNARPVFALSVQPTAAMNPRFGGCRGHTPGPFFSPISLGRNGGPGRAGPPREGGTPVNERRVKDAAPYRSGHTGPAVTGTNGRMISAPTGACRECPDAGRYRSFALILSSAAFSCLADLAYPTAHTITIAMTQRLPVAIYSVVFPARLMKTNSAAMTAGRTAVSYTHLEVAGHHGGR